LQKKDINALIIFLVLLIIGILIALAGSQGGAAAFGIPVFALAVGLIFLIQWLAFVPAFVLQTEKFFDLTGSLTYIAVIKIALLFSIDLDARSYLLLALVVIWAARLGTFLFRRVIKAGKDDRFDELKPNFLRFLNVWTLQALWITFTLATALVAITSTTRKGLDLFAAIGFLIWLIGFAIEAAADTQKSRFSADPHNKDRFISTGLWAHSRHPNYFGEIMLWVGVAIIALPVLQGWQWLALISPVFVTLLLTRVSGVPLLEAKADKKWGNQEDYEAYKKSTPLLIPRL
jgi:steroid 5-alpha reductase family enzyme